VRDDAIIATGRSDYPNQVNNVLCFPFIFRGALDAGATTITEQMKLAAVRAIAELAQAEASDVVAQAYGGESLAFGREYLIPRPFDPRLIVKIAPAVARPPRSRAWPRGRSRTSTPTATKLNSFVYHSGFVMKPVFAAAKKAPRRVVYCEGEDERVLRAVQAVLDEGLAQPVLIGRPDVIAKRIEKAGLRIQGARLRGGESRFRPALQGTLAGLPRDHGPPGRDPGIAKQVVRSDTTLIGTMLLRRGYVDAMLCGVVGPPRAAPQACRRRDRPAAGRALLRRDEHAAAAQAHAVHVRHLRQRRPDGRAGGRDPLMAAKEVRASASSPRWRCSRTPTSAACVRLGLKMAAARALIEQRAPWLEVDGEMHGDAALSQEIRERLYPDCRLKGEANLLIMPNVDAANIAFNLIKATSATASRSARCCSARPGRCTS
jgi:malate dehydrogenase (oxaloacetate-decarboxylating)(NADP+)